MVARSRSWHFLDKVPSVGTCDAGKWEKRNAEIGTLVWIQANIFKYGEDFFFFRKFAYLSFAGFSMLPPAMSNSEHMLKRVKQ